MTKQELLNLFDALHRVGEYKGAKFAYAVAKNIQILKPEVEAITEAQKPSAEFEEYDKQRMQLASKFSKKDKNNEPIIINNRFELDDREGFETAWEALRVTFKDVLAERDKQMKEYQEFLQEEVEVILYKIKEENLPQDISSGQLTAIFAIVE